MKQQFRLTTGPNSYEMLTIYIDSNLAEIDIIENGVRSQKWSGSADDPVAKQFKAKSEVVETV